MRAALVACLLLTACASGTSAPTSYGGRCTSHDGLPDPVCTPGEADPRVTASNLRSTICRRGYTASVRPPRAVSHAIKLRLTKAYGIGSVPFSKVELDHLIPLSLGGASTDANLWPQLRSGAHNVDDKDAIAVSLNHRVCAGSVSLSAAQHAMATNWETAG